MSASKLGAKADVVLVAGPTEDGQGLRVVRAREDRIETGEVRPLRDGQPVTGDIVTLKPREKTPWLCDVEVQHEQRSKVAANDTAALAPLARPTRHGPAQVATEEYRDNWESIFGGAGGRDQSLN